MAPREGPAPIEQRHRPRAHLPSAEYQVLKVDSILQAGENKDQTTRGVVYTDGKMLPPVDFCAGVLRAGFTVRLSPRTSNPSVAWSER